MIGDYHDMNMPAKLANRKTTTDSRTIAALYVRFAWLSCGVAGEVDEGLRLNGGGVDVGVAEMEPVKNVCVAKKSEFDVVMAAPEDAAKNADAWL